MIFRLPSYKLVFSEKLYSEKVLLMHILQETTEGVPKNYPVREVTWSKSVLLVKTFNKYLHRSYILA